MKRPSSNSSSSSSDSVTAGRGAGFISPSSAEEKMLYGGVVGNFPSMLDSFVVDEVGEDQLVDGEDMYSSGLGGGRDGSSSGEKKRRLSVQQVKALEKSFEVENKLEPERKVKLAQEIGLQPRQVAVWFQNRRARWKTKQLERDYGILKTDYDAIKISCDDLRHEKEALLAEITELKAKLAGDSGESYGSVVKDEPLAMVEEEIDDKSSIKGKESAEAQDDETEPPPLVYKDGSSDSDSSAILNDEITSNYLGGSGMLSAHHHYKLEGEEEEEPVLIGFNPFQCQDESGGGKLSFYCYQQHVREEQSIFGEEEPCSSRFFSDEQPPELPWYCSEQWG